MVKYDAHTNTHTVQTCYTYMHAYTHTHIYMQYTRSHIHTQTYAHRSFDVASMGSVHKITYQKGNAQ